MNAFVIDAFEFCRLQERRQGEFAIADLPRLADELADTSGVLQWSLQGGVGMHGNPQLLLSISGIVQLRCQRCLGFFDNDIAAESTLVLAKDDAAADEIEALLDDDEFDVIVGSKAFDVKSLVEDEALLAIPLAPKHDVCPDHAMSEALKNAKKESPFSVLKNLK